MKAMLLIALPFAFAAVAAAWPGERTRPWLLPLAGLVHAALVIWMLIQPPPFAAELIKTGAVRLRLPLILQIATRAIRQGEDPFCKSGRESTRRTFRLRSRTAS